MVSPEFHDKEKIIKYGVPGISKFRVPRHENVSGIGFAIPAAEALKFIQAQEK